MDYNVENQTQEKKKSNIGIIFAFIFLILIIIGLVSYIVIDKKIIKTEEDQKEVTKEENNSVKLSDEEIEKYLSYVPMKTEEDVNGEYGYNVDAYNGKKITINEIDQRLLLLNTYADIEPIARKGKFSFCGKDEFGNIETCEVDAAYLASDVISLIKDRYNVEVKPVDFIIPGGEVVYEGGYFNEWTGRDMYLHNYTSSKVVKYETIDDELVIYEKAIFGFEDEGVDYQVVMTTTTYNESESVGKLYPYEEENYTEDVLLSKFEDKANTFKHVFKKNSKGAYTWYSTEVSE